MIYSILKGEETTYIELCDIILKHHQGVFTFKYHYFKTNGLVRDIVDGTATRYWFNGPGGGGGVKFSALVQTGPGAHSGSCTKGTTSHYPGYRECCMALTTFPHLLLMLH
jgi:hypothetical protein